MQVSFSAFLRSLQIFHLSLCVGVVLVSIVLFNFVGAGEPKSEPTFLYIALAVWLASLCVAFLYAGPKMQRAHEERNLSDKLQAYRSAFVLHLGLLEGPTLICLVLYFFADANPNFLYMAFAAWLSMLSLYQNQDKILKAIRPTNEETKEINDPNALVTSVPERRGYGNKITKF